jgi:hypothetical protein
VRRRVPAGMSSCRMVAVPDLIEKDATICERADKTCPHPKMCAEFGCAQEKIRLTGHSEDATIPERETFEEHQRLCRCYGDAYSGLVCCDYCMDDCHLEADRA